MRASFDRAFRRLTGAFGRYHAIPRDPDSFTEITAARADLDDARADVRAEGERFRTAPENPDFVEPGLGTDAQTTAGKIAAAAFLVVMVVLLVLGVRAFDRASTTPLVFGPVAASSLIEPGDGRCVWTLEAELRNTTDDDVLVRRAWLVTNAGTAPSVGDEFVVPAADTVDASMSFTLVDERCPTEITDITSGRIRINDQFSIRPDLSG